MRKNIVLVLLVVFFAALFVCKEGVAKNTTKKEAGMFEKIYNVAPVTDGVRKITYDQFMQLRNSGEKYVLVDVLSADSFKDGHIEGSISLPFDTINEKSAKAKIAKGSHVVTYCASFQCLASTKAASEIAKLGYKTLDYKGGLKEWQENGNKLVK